jgi:hypothetical protein
MAIRLTNASVTPDRAANNDALSIVCSARSTTGPQTITATYSILDTPNAHLDGDNPKTFAVAKKSRPCPNTLVLRLHGVPPGVYFVVIMAEGTDGKKDVAFAPLTIL